MVATTFAADTPLVVAGLVAKYGVAGNWLWWNGAFSGMLTVFFFARLWRRAGVLTDVEFAELRYGGRPAAVLRGFRALYLALPINLIIMGWVTRAMVTILQITLDIDPVDGGDPALRRDGALQRLLRPLGRHRDRRVPVRRRDGRRRSCSPSSRSSRSAASMRSTAKAAAHFGSAEAAFGVIPPTGSGLAPALDPARLPRRPMVGGLVSRRGAGRRRLRRPAHPRRPRTSATACWRRSGSPSPTMPCGRGRGSWSASSA